MFTIAVGLNTTYGEFKTIEEAKNWATWLLSATLIPKAEVKEI